MYADPRLEPHEKLYIYRKRVGLSQAAMVDNIKSRSSITVNLQLVKDWEAGIQTFDPVLVLPYQPYAISAHEWCAVQRRRAGKTQEKASQMMKLEVSDVKRVESGKADATQMVLFWNNRARKQAQYRARRARGLKY